jgi:Protein of unknown function (DUF4197)
MKRIFFVIFVLCPIFSFAQLGKLLKQAEKAVGAEKSLSAEEVGAGLKEALTNGISKGADLTSKIDGYFKNPEIKLPFPPDVKRVEDKLRQIGLGNQVDDFVLTLNRGAEDAASKAKPIFIDAIKQMTINDAWNILRGQPDAATQYLKRTTTSQLVAQFTPVIRNSLEKTNATKYYGEIVNTYNKIPFTQKANSDLTQYATDRAIQGLFIMIAKEEKNIRENPLARTSDLLKRVFSQK